MSRIEIEDAPASTGDPLTQNIIPDAEYAAKHGPNVLPFPRAVADDPPEAQEDPRDKELREKAEKHESVYP
jgi:hypothetical protein